MTINKTYRAQLEAARRHFGWVERHPYLTNAILATEAVIFALCVYFFYPI